MAIPLWTLPKLRISLTKKLVLGSLFTLAAFAISASIIRCVIVVTNDTSLTKVLIWSTVEEVVVIVVANAPILRPLFFHGKKFEGMTSDNCTTKGTRGYTEAERSLHDAHGLTIVPNNTVEVVTVRLLTVGKRDPALALTLQDAFGSLRTVEIPVHVD